MTNIYTWRYQCLTMKTKTARKNMDKKQLYLRDIYWTFNTTEYELFSSIHGIFSRMDHMLGQKVNEPQLTLKSRNDTKYALWLQ